MKGYRTILLNAAAAALPMLDMVANNGAMLAPFLGQYGAVVLSVLGLANMVLRWVTTTPVFKSE